MSFFTDDDDDDDVLAQHKPKKVATKGKPEENPLSFFSFGSAATSTPKPTASVPTHVLDDSDDDDDWVKSPPGSMKKSSKSSAISTFDFSEEDDIDLPRSSKPRTSDDLAPFAVPDHLGSQRPASAEPTKQSGSLSDKQRIVLLEEQVAKAQQIIAKAKEKEKSDAAQLEKALQGIESNIAKHVERANVAEADKKRVEVELRKAQEQVLQLQAQTRQQAAIIEQMNRGGVPIPTATPTDLDWFAVHEKHQIAVRMLAQASQDAKTGLDLLLKNAPVLTELALLLKDVGRVSESNSR